MAPGTTDPGSPPVVGACAEGATRTCQVDLGQQGDVHICVEGEQLCEGGGWTACGETGPVETKQLHLPGGILPLNAPQSCIDTPCDPSCQAYVEVPTESITATVESTYGWSSGPSYTPPEGALEEPCAWGADCQANHYCDEPLTLACDHSKCEEGAALDATCDPCVASVCDAHPECCQAAPSCEDLYGATTPSYTDCGEGPSGAGTCLMGMYNQNLSCSDVCALGGGTCVDAWDNSGTCGINYGSNIGCDHVGFNSSVCVCDRPGFDPNAGWSETCVDAVHTQCGAFCDDTTPLPVTGPEESGTCQHWDPGQTDPSCAGVNLTVDTPCSGTIPVCNVGQSTAPAGIDVAVYPPGSDVLGTCASIALSPSGTCTTAEPIPPGTCVSVTGCGGLVSGAEVVVDPAGLVGECTPGACLDNGSPYEPAACGTPSCSNAASEESFRPVNMFIMIDKSGSMGSNGMWTPAMSAIKSFVQSPDLDGVSVGLRFYPDNSPTSGCTNACNVAACSDPLVPVAPLSAIAGDAQEQALVNAIDSRSPGGGTPTRVALAGATSWGELQALANPREENVVVFITDGEPTQCGTDADAIIAPAREAHDFYGVRTYAIGLEGANQDLMDGIADAGGTGAAFYVSNNSTVEQQLLDALLAIQGTPLTCDIEIPSGTAFNAQQTVLTFLPGDGSVDEVTRVNDASSCSGDGWYYDDLAQPTEVSLCPATCSAAQAPVTSCNGPGEQKSPLDDACYRLETTPLTWADAEASCEAWGGHLVSFRNRRDAGFVERAFGLTGQTWIGARDAALEGTWTWSDDSYLSYQAWASSQPSGSAGHDCASVDGTGAWFDQSCSAMRPSICERREEDRRVRLHLGCPDGYATTEVVDVYEGQCGSGQQAQWSFLAYESVTPADSAIAFEVRGANDPGELASASWVPVGVAAQSPVDTQSCSFLGPSPCPLSLYDALGPDAKSRFVELRATLEPGGADSTVTPILTSWQLTYSCVDDF